MRESSYTPTIINWYLLMEFIDSARNPRRAVRQSVNDRAGYMGVLACAFSSVSDVKIGFKILLSLLPVYSTVTNFTLLSILSAAYSIASITR